MPVAAPDILAKGRRPVRSAETAPRRTARASGAMLAILLAFPLLATLFGLPYYLMGPGARLRSPLHDWLKPSGLIGLSFGVAGLALFLFMWLYPLRKRYRWLSFTGAVPAWLDVHIVAGLAVPFVVAAHAGWRFEGLIGLGYLSMVLVALSGVVGRYLYVHIPRSQSGIELTMEELAARRRGLITEIAATLRVDPTRVERTLTLDSGEGRGDGPLGTMKHMLMDDFSRWKAARALERQWRQTGRAGSDRRLIAHALQLARREIALGQQARMLAATRRVFGLWHVAHRPFAMTALLAILIHVVVAVVVGAVNWR